MHAVIMAGGKGTRLQSISKDIPKPLFPVLGKPILEYQIESLKKSSVTDLTIIVGHLGQAIRDYFQSGEKWGVKIEYITEEYPLGTAGALYYLKNKLHEDFLLLSGDLILDVDWSRFMDFHKRSGGSITLYGHPNAHPYDSDVIVTENNGKVVRIESKNVPRDFYYHNFVNAGIYCMSPAVLETLQVPQKLDLEKTVIAEQIKIGRVYAYKSTEYVKDMGTPDRLESVTGDIKNGVVESRSLRKKQKAVFLDRDGTINVLKGFLKSAADFELLPGVCDAIRKLNASEYLTIIATNQPVVARGECSLKELEQIHMRLETELGKEGAFVDDVFFCPHHPHKGYAGEIEALKIDCECRKPKIGMLLRAAEKYNIDLSASWYVGDTTVDIQTGINAGMRTILLHTGEAGKDGKFEVTPDYEAQNLCEAVGIILQRV